MFGQALCKSTRPICIYEYTRKQMVRELEEKFILHWNYRGFTKLPEVVKNYGTHIQEIYLKWNRLCSLPCWIGELSNITNLYLHGNQIETLPDEIGEMTQLNTLDLGHNKLKSLPRQIGRLENLQTLILNKNLLRILPYEISQLKNLETLSVCGNQLIALPEWLGSLPCLEELIADRNGLTELPNRLTFAARLSTISVCSNRLQYLPLNGFLSAPYIQFDCNPIINYLSVPVSYQLSRRIQYFRDARDIPAYRCSIGPVRDEDNCGKEFKLNIHLKVEMPDEAVQKTSIIKLPRQLVTVHDITENYVPSLWELALRQIYCTRFKHTLEVNHSTQDVIVNRIKQNLQSKSKSSEVIGYMQNLLNNGPASICLSNNCQQPIFTEAWIIVNSNTWTNFLQLSVFCSKKCLREFTELTDVLATNRPWCIV
ncbi:disease resistance protein Pik-1-like isoform X1 [Neodiprion fabricii]|uniref:disease resistance protein Pik-1-like isoform X1 n=2 Tax=Neodiprion fabricii TaxID=2872261 RepID=UPI001ED97E30|nr:disease resistance protein Pik-1-like isoform X1 [Neodiprion fabricii]